MLDVMSKPDASGRLCPGSAPRPTEIGCGEERPEDAQATSTKSKSINQDNRIANSGPVNQPVEPINLSPFCRALRGANIR